MKRSKLKPISSKRAKEMVKYRKAKKEYLEEHNRCEGCNLYAVLEIHHKKSRVADLLYDKKYFMALCRGCHQFAHDNPKEATQRRWLLDRISPFTSI